MKVKAFLRLFFPTSQLFSPIWSNGLIARKKVRNIYCIAAKKGFGHHRDWLSFFLSSFFPFLPFPFNFVIAKIRSKRGKHPWPPPWIQIAGPFFVEVKPTVAPPPQTHPFSTFFPIPLRFFFAQFQPIWLRVNLLLRKEPSEKNRRSERGREKMGLRMTFTTRPYYYQCSSSQE